MEESRHLPPGAATRHLERMVGAPLRGVRGRTEVGWSVILPGSSCLALRTAAMAKAALPKANGRDAVAPLSKTGLGG
jgi:hypothetical protein